VIFAALLTTTPSPALAQAETGAQVLDMMLSTRGNAMAWSGTADRSDPGNIYFNPANVTAVNGVFATGAYEKLIPALADDLWLGRLNVGAGRVIGEDTPILVAFGYTWGKLSYGESVATDSQGRSTGTFESWEEVFGLTAGVSGAAGERGTWALGVGIKRLSLEYAPAEFVVGEPETRDDSVTMLDLGFVLSTVVDASDWKVRPALGLAAVNMGSDIEFEIDGEKREDPLPSWFNYGVSVRIDGPLVTLGSIETPSITSILNVDGNHGLNDQRPRWGFGYEISLMQIIFARWGRRTDDRFHRAEETWGVALGIPAGPLRARLEYANDAPYYAYGSGDTFGATLVWMFGDGGARNRVEGGGSK
jgi:hypothetical protein